MGIAETYSRGRRFAVDRPGALILAFVGVLLLGDLLVGLATGQTALSDVGSLVWDGLMRGLVIGLAGIGLSMTYSILNFANFAHGDFITAGAFSGWATTYVLAGLGRADIGALVLVGAGGSVFGGTLGIGITGTPLAVIAGLLVAGAFTIVLSLAVDRAIFRPIRDEDGITLLITSIGVAFALRYMMQFVFGSNVRGTTAQPPSFAVYLLDGAVRINMHDLTLVVVAGGLMLGVHLLLQRTKLGKAMRAMADNEDLARVTGIPTERVVRSVWVIGGGLTGVAGYMFVLWKGTLGFNDGWLLLLLIFAAVILGGIGSIYGAIAGGLVIGLTASLSVLWIPSAFARAAAFVVMIVILLVKPSGLFSGRSTA
ncbi:branched-chain amino acid ABC transporter permease [Halogeometricum borinquense]|uniref:amino acid/amide ABC transporter membrane protein 1, HAAT family n=2 Tax=Halogeometricum borinquense TaxID=60847 RepID=E4NRS3_HALBP|nr:branched-chain amino acid ABC transporter permease [Halogeometricum borinquense]ADQ66860.1 amino acid/amide ABC transporter membrane protein 1, HAAT family [Halogeometricum borinquense DSM 11551]ELY30368.1 amino acid/amide ABC transporter membrane protein 1, haat family [Halogeometricum borinquense DSM 11551]QIB74826.1 branched-chain amino acid ABC transporter permease [Halogeometricum borinquense]QIQ76176.1 branched-chain amino acid ABC transporter permease [Halogeometricum borinquense]RYJ